MKAAPDMQLRLLDLQQIDAALDRLAHRRRTLGELAEIERLAARLAELRDLIVAAETLEGDAAREQLKAEADVDQVRTRMARDQQRLDSGQVGSPKELENLQSEIQSLTRRQAALEDAVLEIMEKREGMQGTVLELTGERDRVLGELAELEQRRDATFQEIDAEAGISRQARDRVASDVPADLLALYEKVRAHSNGVGAAALHRGRCEGCHLALNPADLSRIRSAPDDEVLRCEECSRILVRTAESGL